MAEGAMGGYELYRDEQDEKTNSAAQSEALISALGGPQPAPMQPQAPVQPPQRQPVQPQAIAPRNQMVAALQTDVPAPPRAPVMPTPKVWGDKEAEQAGLYPPSGPASAPLQPTPVQTERILPPANDRIAQAHGDMNSQIVQMLSNQNPAVQGMGRKLAAGVLQKRLEGEKPTDDIRDYQFAKQQGFQGSLLDFIATKRAGAGEYGLTPIWGTGPDGKPAFIQPGKSGKAIQGQIPEGFNVAKDPIKVDAGTDWILLDPQTRQPVGRISKNVAAKEAEEKIGAAQGTAKVGLPGAEVTTTRALTMLKQLEDHPGFSEGTGFILGRLPALTPKAADFRERVGQIDSMVFGDAVEVMRGLGALTDKEGPRITAARARLNTAKSEEDFRQAIKDVREVFQDGIKNMRTKAGVSAPTDAPAAGAPNIDDLVKKWTK
jgi:hypothetical protein